MSTNRRETVTITNLIGDSERVTLPKPHYENPKGSRSEDTTGTWWEALYVSPRTGRMFVRIGHGRCVGTTYSELSRADYLWYCERIGCSPVGQSATGAEA